MFRATLERISVSDWLWLIDDSKQRLEPAMSRLIGEEVSVRFSKFYLMAYIW